MKKAGFGLLFMTVCTAILFTTTLVNANNVQDDWEDHVALSREGGTTRASRSMYSIQSFTVEPAVEAQIGKNEVFISVQDYRGPVFVEIYGVKGIKQSFFEVYDMGVEVVSLSGLGADEYTICITLGDVVYTGTIYKGKYGHRK